YFDIATNPKMRNLVHVSRLQIGSTWAAANLGLTFRGCYYYVLPSHDFGPLARFSPGAVHLRELMRTAIDLGFKWFDFTIGDEQYKQKWCDTTLALYDHMVPATPRGWPVTLLSIVVRRQIGRARVG